MRIVERQHGLQRARQFLRFIARGEENGDSLGNPGLAVAPRWQVMECAKTPRATAMDAQTHSNATIASSTVDEQMHRSISSATIANLKLCYHAAWTALFRSSAQVASDGRSEGVFTDLAGGPARSSHDLLPRRAPPSARSARGEPTRGIAFEVFAARVILIATPDGEIERTAALLAKIGGAKCRGRIFLHTQRRPRLFGASRSRAARRRDRIAASDADFYRSKNSAAR